MGVTEPVQPKKYPFFLTDDGTYTLYSPEYEETYHSRGGARTEALERFLWPCRIPQLAQQSSLHIFEVGFGLGINLAATLAWLREHSFQGELIYIGLEKDEHLLHWLGQEDHPFWGEEEAWLRPLVQKKHYTDTVPFSINATILIGRAEELLPQLLSDYPQFFHALYHDPFSPKKNPELWSSEFFSYLRQILSPSAILSTYSSAIRVRLNLLAAGFRIGLGPKAAGKSTGTLASISAPLPPFPEKFWKKLLRRYEKEFGTAPPHLSPDSSAQ